MFAVELQASFVVRRDICEQMVDSHASSLRDEFVKHHLAESFSSVLWENEVGYQRASLEGIGPRVLVQKSETDHVTRLGLRH